MKLTSILTLTASSVALLASAPAFAQDDAGEDDSKVLSTVTVTGSFIPGTPEDAALPVDVLSAEDLQLEGSPSITELIRNLGVSSGVDGQTNQFASNGLEGTSNVNLRGLGPARTLVLLNGRRQTFSPYAIGEQAQLFVDTNMIPSAAIGRIEVLKDGAAALYGSDAIAGVANFITRTDLDGLEIGGSYQTFEGSDGEYDISAAYGFQGDNWNWITSVGYQTKEEVPLLEKDWAILSYEGNQVGGWSSLSNPGYYVPLGITAGGVAPIAGSVSDNGCEALGGTLAPTCRFQFTQYDNLVEEEEKYQIFSEYNRTFGNGMNFHIEGLYGKTEVPEWKTSPSYPPQVLTSQVVPVSHPGFQQYIADNPGAFPAGTVAALYLGRTFGWGGFPGTGGAQEGVREHETFRVSTSLDGTFANDINYDFGLSYSGAEAYRLTNDTYIAGLSAALNGFGLCADPVTGAIDAGAVAGQGGCQYYNPFSNAIPASGVTGAANPNYVPGLENTPELADWLTDPTETTVNTDLLVFDGVISGLSGVQASGGEVGWAAGFQVRRESYEVAASALTDLEVTPGPGGTGPFSFLAGTNTSDEDQTIYALFGELQIPLYEDLDIQIATRYEDYGGEVGSTFDPKVAAKWQASDSLAFRGSAQTSFRGPTLNQLSGVATTLQFVAPTSAFKAVDQFGNPELDPESAFSYNFGALYQTGGFSASLDYYSFDFSDPIIVEEQSNIVAAAVAALAAGDLENPVLSRITFQDPTAPTAADIARIETNIVNGPDIKTSGIDFRAENIWDISNGGEITLGTDLTYVLEYEVDPYFVEGVAIGGGDYAGQFNRSNFTRSLPQLKGNFYANYAYGAHNLRAVVRHISAYDDERGDVTPLNGRDDSEIDAQTTVDLFYNADLPYEFNLGLSVVNVFDEDPPFAQFDLNYDPYTHNPFGQTFKVSLKKTFTGLGSGN